MNVFNGSIGLVLVISIFFRNNYTLATNYNNIIIIHIYSKRKFNKATMSELLINVLTSVLTLKGLNRFFYNNFIVYASRLITLPVFNY